MNDAVATHTPENMARWWGTTPAGVTWGARKGLSAATWHFDRHDSFEVSADPDALTHIVCPVLQGAIDVDIFIDDRWRYRDHIRPGQFNLIRAGERPRAIVHAPQVRFMHIYLPDALLRRCVEEAFHGRADGFELVLTGIEHDRIISGFAAGIEAEMSAPAIGSGLILDGLTLQLAGHLVRRWSNRSTRMHEGGQATGGLAPWQARRCIDYLHTNVDRDVSIHALAGLCGLSPFHFARQFKRSTGLPPHAYHLRLRIEQAQARMQDSRLPLADIAAACGFASQQHFTTAFKRHVGSTPAAWRRDRRG